jgi:hypothetical protein
MTNLNKILEFVGGISIAIFAILGLTKTLFVDWVKNKWSTRTDKQLEKLKGEIALYNASLNSITSGFLNNYQKVQEKRIEAAQILWRAILGIKYGMPYEVAFAIRAYNEEDLKKAAGNTKNEINIRIISADILPYQNLIHDTLKDLEEYKPFISDRAYLYYETYANFNFRYASLIIKGMKNGNMVLWTEDILLKSFATILTTEEQLKLIQQNQFNSFILLQQVAEKNIISELRESINGVNMSIDIADYIKSTSELLKDNHKKL